MIVSMKHLRSMTLTSLQPLAMMAALACAAGCENKPEVGAEKPATEAKAEGAEAKKDEAPAQKKMALHPAPSVQAAIGQPAPDFTLKDLDGNEISLSRFQGATVVLEWFNPGCPFVKASHGKGSLKDLAAKHKKEVVWLAINSGAPGKEGTGLEANRNGLSEFGMEHPLLLDEDGKVGRMYGAERTPHLFVIDPKGVLVYQGAIDNSPDGIGESPTGGKLVNYVDNALTAIKEGKPVEPAETKAYGCSVKYGES